MSTESRCYSFGRSVHPGPGSGVLLRHGTRVPLTPRTLDLLAVLMTYAGDVLEKDELSRRVWGSTVC